MPGSTANCIFLGVYVWFLARFLDLQECLIVEECVIRCDSNTDHRQSQKKIKKNSMKVGGCVCVWVGGC